MRMTRSLRAAIVACLLILVLLPSGARGGASVGQSPARAQYLVVIVMDGFRPDYLTLAPMHHLHALMRSGRSYSRAWVGQLETQTPTGHATIVTGVYPKKHGVMGFVWRDPTGQGVTWMPTNRGMLNAGDMEGLIQSAGVPSISQLMRATYPGSKSAAVSGEKLYAADAMGVGADYIVWGDSYDKNRGWIVPTAIGQHVPPARSRFQSLKVRWDGQPMGQDPFASAMAVQLFRTLRPRTLLVNLPSVDIEGHRDGGVTDTETMRDTIRGTDAAIGRIVNAYRAAGLYDKTLFVVTADHGMVPNGYVVKRQAMYDAVRATGAQWLEEDFLSTAGYVYLRDPADTPTVAGRLASGHFKGVEGVLYRASGAAAGSEFVAEPSTAKKLGPDLTRAYLDLSDTLASPAGPDIVLPYAEDTVGLTVKGYGPHWGSHGGLSWRVQHIPLVLSGPGVERGTSAFPAKLVDVAPTIERLMGLPVPAGVDGTVLADAVKGASSADRASQHAVASSRSRDVDVLRLHSRQQHGMALSNQ